MLRLLRWKSGHYFRCRRPVTTSRHFITLIITSQYHFYLHNNFHNLLIKIVVITLLQSQPWSTPARPSTRRLVPVLNARTVPPTPRRRFLSSPGRLVLSCSKQEVPLENRLQIEEVWAEIGTESGRDLPSKDISSTSTIISRPHWFPSVAHRRRPAGRTSTKTI